MSHCVSRLEIDQLIRSRRQKYSLQFLIQNLKHTRLFFLNIKITNVAFWTACASLCRYLDWDDPIIFMSTPHILITCMAPLLSLAWNVTRLYFLTYRVLLEAILNSPDQIQGVLLFSNTLHKNTSAWCAISLHKILQQLLHMWLQYFDVGSIPTVFHQVIQIRITAGSIFF